MARRIPRKSNCESLEKKPLKKKSLFGSDLLDTIDETPELHDSYSELHLFLSQKIKQEMRHCSNPKKWSLQLQEELLNKISPEFQKRFPKYRLGTLTIKKTWEKVQFFSTQIQDKKEALTQDGKLNIPFFIKENLKTAPTLQNTCHLHPCHYAHQLAVKMSECIAVVDGIRPKLDQLTQTIWVLQRHLIPLQDSECLHQKTKNIDKLIVKVLLEITSQHPDMSQVELSFHIKKKLLQLHYVSTTYTSNQMQKMLTALYADQCHFLNQRMERTLERIPYSTAKCLKQQLASIVFDHPLFEPEQVIKEALVFFEKASIALKNLDETELEGKIQNWAIQNDMLLRWIRFNPSSILYKEVKTAWQRSKNIKETIHIAQTQFLEKYPHGMGFAKELERCALIYLKHLWYAELFNEKIPTYDRFIQWQKEMLKRQNLPPSALIEKIEEVCRKKLPLIPFDRSRAQTSMFAEEKQ